MSLLQNTKAIYVVNPEYQDVLSEELGGKGQVEGDLIFSTIADTKVCFAQDIWLSPRIETFQSISEATSILRSQGRFWYMHPLTHIRRAKLIESGLRQWKQKDITFPMPIDMPAIGVFTLLDKQTLVYSQNRLKQPPDGVYRFVEDKVNPPNRAYLKLWEALSVLGKYPKQGDSALDLGASPGGWTYVMQSLGCQVTAVDKAPLAKEIAQLPAVDFLQQSAFAIEPAKLTKEYDWVLSDVACYPDKAFNLVNKWIQSKKAKQLIFTIKLQGATDLTAIKQFQDIPGSYVCHLYQNKHEVTFFYPHPSV